MSRILVSLALTIALAPVTPTAAQPADSMAITDSLKMALQQFERAETSTAADSARLRRWADSVQTKSSNSLFIKPVQARDNFRLALRAYRALADTTAVAGLLGGVALTYEVQGQYEKALINLRQSLKKARELDDRSEIGRAMNRIGIVQSGQGRYEEALSSYRESLEIARELGKRPNIADALGNLAIVQQKQGHYEEALSNHREALKLERSFANRSRIANRRRIIGTAYQRQGRYDEALNNYQAALTISREIESLPYAAVSLKHIGTLQLQNGRLLEATDTLRRAVRLTEQLRTRPQAPASRRYLLSAQIDAYRALTTAHVGSGRPDSALRSVEQARARLLADRLAGTATGDTSFALPSVKVLRQTLGPDEAALLYANAGSKWPLTALAVTRDTTVARELPDSTMRAAIEKAYPTQLNRLRRTDGPLTAALDSDPSQGGGATPSLAETIRLYRHNLTRQQADASVRRDLARRFHQLLVEPVEGQIAGNDELLVVPTGTLGYLPFETLRDSTGQYLVEQKHVRYAQSLTVLRQLRHRDYAEQERSLLAFGGAAYESDPKTKGSGLVAEARGGSTRVATRGHASALVQNAERRMEQGRSPRPTYQRLGYAYWPDLPGTQSEVEKLGTIAGESATVITGAGASEDSVRALDASGRLGEYRRVHFATHGVAVPETPELSALVLSQVGASDSLAARDGYLTMDELAGLDLKADVAVLSACQTGLGKVVAGEGVVSLSHAFLRAGANATLVSQWKVLDKSTRQFMTAVYERAKNEDTSFAEAVTETKRAFIAGEYGKKNKDPLRWAPFVYYGRE